MRFDFIPTSHKKFTYLVVHPSVPLGGYLRGVILETNVFGEFHPTIASVKIVRILKILVPVFVLADQFSWLDIVVTIRISKQSGKITFQNNIPKQHADRGYCCAFNLCNAEPHLFPPNIYLPEQLQVAGADTAVHADHLDEAHGFIDTQIFGHVETMGQIWIPQNTKNTFLL